MKTLGVLMVCIVLIGAGTLSAHHNLSAIFDFNRRFITLPNGKVVWSCPQAC